METLIYCIGAFLFGVCATWLYHKPERKRLKELEEQPYVVEKHWIGHTVQERWHYERNNDYLSKN